MLTSIRIQNFRSIRDAQVKLGQVNLFIGPNNSGKSNFLKGIEFAANSIEGQKYTEEEFDQIITRASIRARTAEPTHPALKRLSDIILEAGVESISPLVTPYDTIILNRDGGNINVYPSHKFDNEQAHEEFKSTIDYNEQKTFFDNAPFRLKRIIHKTLVYKPDPAKFITTGAIEIAEKLDANGENIANFLFNLSQNHQDIFQQFEIDFKNCVESLNRVATPANPLAKGQLKLKFFDPLGNSYWAEEVSEGVLYFLALLCIIHQPDPPKLLLLEEPEKGIHPRRIREVMDFIFELARLRDIQIILTSHSPYVVDHFADIPECISVFDRENGETVIRNAADIMTEANTKLEAAGHKPIRYTDALGEYWVSGFLGGVPEMTSGAA